MIHNIKLRAAAKSVALAELEGEEILFIGPPDGELPTADDSGLIIVCSGGKYVHLSAEDSIVCTNHPSGSAALDLLLSADTLQSIGLITPRMANNMRNEIAAQKAAFTQLRIDNLRAELQRLEALK